MTQNAVVINREMSNPAKILLGFMKATGKWDSRELAAEFNIPLRTIQRWKTECFDSAIDATDAISGVPSAHEQNATRATDANSGAPLTPKTPDMALARNLHSCAGATNELPTEVLISKVVTPLAPQGGRTRGSRLDSDWQLPADWHTWARTNFPASNDDQVADQAAQFRDYWIAKPGAQACKLDWEATWRNWCRKGLSAYGSVRKPQSTGSFKPNGFVPYVVPYVAPKQSKGISQAQLEAMVLADEAEWEASRGVR